ncbi:MAG TPA: glycerol-3-phosphate 1-O-acyltransferase PlsY [Methylotenera sp.]|nr:glycerol-3-phosphate 1-O-acyltransferase PlsY [Methylotenera sp.]
MIQAGFIVLAYLLGSISFGILMSKAFGLPDPRTVGSGNPGATNVARSGKKLPAILTLLGDAAKGWLAVFLAQKYGLHDGYICLVGIAAFLGHLYPVFCGFKGGKGVATALGVLLAFSAWLGLAVLVVWAVAFAIWRYSSLAALIAAGVSPLFAWWLLPYMGYGTTALILALILTWRHKTNIEKLFAGTESGFRKK